MTVFGVNRDYIEEIARPRSVPNWVRIHSAACHTGRLVTFYNIPQSSSAVRPRRSVRLSDALREVRRTLLQDGHRRLFFFFRDSAHHLLAQDRRHIRDCPPPSRALGGELEIIRSAVFLAGSSFEPSLPDEAIHDHRHAS
jgi:hypothetical protein